MEYTPGAILFHRSELSSLFPETCTIHPARHACCYKDGVSARLRDPVETGSQLTGGRGLCFSRAVSQRTKKRHRGRDPPGSSSPMIPAGLRPPTRAPGSRPSSGVERSPRPRRCPMGVGRALHEAVRLTARPSVPVFCLPALHEAALPREPLLFCPIPFRPIPFRPLLSQSLFNESGAGNSNAVEGSLIRFPPTGGETPKRGGGDPPGNRGRTVRSC